MKPTIIILVGITGDLSKRKLLPAIEGLREKGLLPEKFKLVGVTRRDDPELFKMDLDDGVDYLRLKDHLQDIEDEWGESAQRLFYLSVGPAVSLPIIEQLGAAGLADVPDTKLLLEKPFGLDGDTAEKFIMTIDQYFSEEQVYRIDHYLAKGSVRELSKKGVDIAALDRIEISASEKIGIEGRGNFYEQTGALRDFIQSHLLQVAAIALSPHNRLQALEQLDASIADTKRGQYIGYRDVVENQESVVETYVSVSLQSRDPQLAGVTIVVQSGKAMNEKSTDVSFLYKDGGFEIVSLDDTNNAYEQVFFDAMNGDKTFFVSKSEVLETWRIVSPIQYAWQQGNDDLMFYEQGSVL